MYLHSSKDNSKSYDNRKRKTIGDYKYQNSAQLTDPKVLVCSSFLAVKIESLDDLQIHETKK
jgi:hypothetical protein